MQTTNTPAVLTAIAEAQVNLAKAQKAVLSGKPEKAREVLQRVSTGVAAVFNAV